MTGIETALLADEPAILSDLMDYCRIASVSTDPAFAPEIARAADFVAEELRRAGFPVVERIETGGHPAVYAERCDVPGAPTVLVYGHYDVQPPDPLEAWASPPFEPTLRDDRLYARGVSDDKAPLLIAIKVAAAFARLRGGLPVNMKFLIEGEEESGSPHFAPTVARLRDRLASDVVLSADGAMWRADLPSVMVAGRGLVAFEVRLSGAGKDLHSGRHGGSAPNPIRALARMLAALHDDEGRVIVPGFADGATAPDPAILDAIRHADFDSAAYFAGIGAALPDPLPDAETLLRRQWLEPTLEFNGISGGYEGAGTKTVIPSDARVKITCRLVAGQTPDRVARALEAELRRLTPTGYRLEFTRHGPGSAAFALDPADPALHLAEEVLGEVLGAAPLRVAMGATIPIPDVFRRELGVGTVFFSFSTADEDYHAPNEFFRLSSLRRGLVAWARLLDRLGGMPAAALRGKAGA
ncbi:MAG: M20/M25/M40 family metallo-hydrolase [Paracoccaceae bacterium]|nr:M20/M25/M40 family metallo-hydrolase [Paracoccaceae bacterium]